MVEKFYEYLFPNYFKLWLSGGWREEVKEQIRRALIKDLKLFLQDSWRHAALARRQD